MSEGEGTTETIERKYVGKYLPADFAERAPVDADVDGLLIWLDKDLHKTVREEIDAQAEFLTSPEELPFNVRDHLEHSRKWETKVVGQTLFRYAQYAHRIATHSDPEKIARSKAARAKMPEDLQKRMRPKTVEELKARKLAVEQLIHDFGLSQEAAAIDQLFEQAGAIPSDSGQVIENKPPEASPAKT